MTTLFPQSLPSCRNHDCRFGYVTANYDDGYDKRADACFVDSNCVVFCERFVIG
jgi:hypothetical protein